MDSDTRDMAPDHARSRRRRRVIVLLIVVVVIAITAALFGPAAVRVVSLAKRAASLRGFLNASPDELMREESRQRLLDELQYTSRDLHGLRAALGWFLPLAPGLEPIPYLGGTLASVPHFLDLGIALCSAGVATLKGAGDLIPVLSDASSTTNVTSEVTRALIASRPKFASVEREIDRASAARSQFPEAPLIPPVASGVTAIDRLLPLAQAAAQFAQIAPDLLGAEGTRTYLIMAQNDDELRATGGFITGIGVATLEEGELVDFGFQDSYDVEDWSQPHPDPPESLRKHMMADLWVTRDANWSPDFPTSARALQDLYHLNQGTRADGVISTDLKGLEYLVYGLGPLILSEDEAPITANNVQRRIREMWNPPPEIATNAKMRRQWVMSRKDFMPKLSSAILAKLEDPSSVDWGTLLWSLKRALDEKHLMLFFNDPAAQAVVVGNGWGGELSDPPGDYLMVVDSNVGFNKVNPNIEQRISYQVRIDPGGRSRGVVTLEYQSNVTRVLTDCLQFAQPEWGESYDLMTQRCYFDYVRVYVPSGSALLRTSGEAEFNPSEEELGKTMFSAFLVLAPGETGRLVFEYELPTQTMIRGDEEDRYVLTVQKQPGTRPYPIQVEISVPNGVKIMDASPSPSQREASYLRYDLDLTTDLTVALSFRPD